VTGCLVGVAAIHTETKIWRFCGSISEIETICAVMCRIESDVSEATCHDYQFISFNDFVVN
jgi:hypothetical protein